MPITTAGRFDGAAIMFMGVALLGVLAGSLASFFGLQSDGAEDEEDDDEEEQGEVSNESVLTQLALLRAEMTGIADLREQLTVLTSHLAAGDTPAPGTGAE